MNTKRKPFVGYLWVGYLWVRWFGFIWSRVRGRASRRAHTVGVGRVA